MGLALGMALVGGALLLVALVLVPAGPGRVSMARLDPTAVAGPSPLAGAAAGAGAAIERAMDRRGLTARAVTALEAAGLKVAPADFVLVVGVVAVVAGAAGALLGGLLLGLLFALATPLAAKVFLSFRTGRRRTAFSDQLDDSLQMMASSLRAGHSLLRAVDAVSREAEAPTSEEFARIVNETRVGRDLDDAFADVCARMGSDDFVWLAQAIAIHREVGGNLAEVLDAIGHTIRERNAIRRQVKALAAEGKLSAIVLMALPFGIVAFLTMTNPSYLAKFTTTGLGWAMITAACVLLTVGGLWLKKTVTMRF
jgi:tight adherence protein B